MKAKYSSLIRDCYTCTGCIKIFFKGILCDAYYIAVDCL